jgi:hypothetical protein
MTLPGFTADMSLYRTRTAYSGGGAPERRTEGVWAQQVPQVPNRCTWLAFCCREHLYPWCCELFWRRCVPE